MAEVARRVEISIPLLNGWLFLCGLRFLKIYKAGSALGTTLFRSYVIKTEPSRFPVAKSATESEYDFEPLVYVENDRADIAVIDHVP